MQKIFITKNDRNAIRRQKRLMENKEKWKKEEDKMKKLQEEYLNGK